MIPPWAWLVALTGLVIMLGAAVAELFLGDVYFFVIVAGLPLLGIGSYFLSGRRFVPAVPVTLFAGGVFAFGALSGAGGLARNLWGTTATCQVKDVQREVTYNTQSEGNRSRIEVKTSYAHETSCADGTYWINADHPRPVGDRVEVLYDPRTHDDPVFVVNGDTHQDVTMSVVMLAFSGPAIVLLPFVSWRLGRRRVRRGRSAYGGQYGPSPGPAGPAPFNPAYGQGQWGAPPPGPGQPGGHELPPINSPHFERAIRETPSYQTASPGARMMMPFAIRLLRRRMGVPQPPPPNPLAQPQQQPPPPPRQAPPPPPRQAPPPPQYGQWPSNQPPDQTR